MAQKNLVLVSTSIVLPLCLGVDEPKNTYSIVEDEVKPRVLDFLFLHPLIGEEIAQDIFDLSRVFDAVRQKERKVLRTLR